VEDSGKKYATVKNVTRERIRHSPKGIKEGHESKKGESAKTCSMSVGKVERSNQGNGHASTGSKRAGSPSTIEGVKTLGSGGGPKGNDGIGDSSVKSGSKGKTSGKEGLSQISHRWEPWGVYKEMHCELFLRYGVVDHRVIELADALVPVTYPQRLYWTTRGLQSRAHGGVLLRDGPVA